MTQSTQSLILGWDGWGEYRVRTGGEPVIDFTVGDIHPVEAAICACMSVLPMALPLFGLEPLHGSAVGSRRAVADGDRRPALALMGASGSGKSTLTAALLAMGHEFVADDACAIDRDGTLWPGPPLLGLRTPSDHAPDIGEVVGGYDGKDVIRPARWCGRSATLRVALVLDPRPGAPLQVTTASSREALPMLLRQVRGASVGGQRRSAMQLAAVTRLARDATVAVLSYDQTWHPVAETAGVASAFFEAVVEGVSASTRPAVQSTG